MGIIKIENAVPRFEDFRFAEPVSWTINEGENWAVIGCNGAGKSMLIDILLQQIALKDGSVSLGELTRRDIMQMSFRDIYSMADCKTMYYQQRWNATDVDEAPLVSSLLKGFSADEIEHYSTFFHIDTLLPKRLISLSSGELRKFLLVRALMSKPHVLVLDNPYIGLDAPSREVVDNILLEMHKMNGLQIILILSNPMDIPTWINHVLPVHQRHLLPPCTPQEFSNNTDLINELFPAGTSFSGTLPLAVTPPAADYETAVLMENVNIRYNDHYILRNLCWQIGRGDKWALLGENGSGKSTLLSLVCGDNPQSYANKITLFDRKRGSGESIWDIKKRIGYLSPDMHTFYLKDIPCADVVASGFFDSIGLYRRCDDAQRNTARKWLAVFDAEYLADRSFVKISYGEQRIVLLARAFVKNPELLILDEPLHGLDAGKKRRAKSVIETYCADPNKTLIYVTHYVHEIPSCVTKEKRLIKIKN